MQIYCPKCDIGYEIDEDLIREKPRKVRCSNCGEIFEAKIEDDLSEEDAFASLSRAMADEVEKDNFAKEGNFKEIKTAEEIAVDKIIEENNEKDSEPFFERKEEFFEDKKSESDEEEQSEITSENELESFDDMPEETNGAEVVAEEELDSDIKLEDIFVRLSEHTEKLIDREKKLPFYEKLWLQIRNVLGFHFKIKWKYIFIGLGVFVLLSLFNNRYQVVREVPFLNGVYKAFGVKAKIAGEGLEFQNINWNFIDDKDGPILYYGFVTKMFLYLVSPHATTAFEQSYQFYYK